MTTVQDLGRVSFQDIGVPVSGAMDRLALRIGNILLGNDENDAALEVTMPGLSLRFLHETAISITGGDLLPTLGNEKLPMWTKIKVKKGDIVSFKSLRKGLRAYLCVAGGIDVPVVMGSRSTYLLGAFGGYEGRMLRAGDRLFCFDKDSLVSDSVDIIDLIPNYSEHIKIRVLPGPQWDRFSHEGKETFLSSTYKVTPKADRMGIRLEGPTISHGEGGPDIISQGTVMGAIQVPGNGHPIILMADRQTTGGYTVIGVVIDVDIPMLAQIRPGQTVSFETVSLEVAHKLLENREKRINQLKESLSVI